MVHRLDTIDDTTVMTILRCDSSDAITLIDILNSNSPNMTTAIYGSDGSITTIRNISITDGVSGVVFDSGASGSLTNGELSNLTTGLSIPNVGANTSVVIGNITMQNNTLNISVQSTSATISGGFRGSYTATDIVAGASEYLSVLDLTEDDEGLSVLGELHVGRPEVPSDRDWETSAYGSTC